MTDMPIRANPIERRTRQLIEDAERGAAAHHAELGDFARQIVAGRKQRELYFDPMLFSNPAWDILLNLFVADADARPVTVLDACRGSTVPQGVALRWLCYLKQEEMVLETSDLSCDRQTLIQLSDHARLAIGAYLGSLTALGLGPERAGAVGRR